QGNFTRDMIIQGEVQRAQLALQNGKQDVISRFVPRWEWRTFDASLNAIEGRIAAALEQVAPHTSAEIYLLRLGGPQNARFEMVLLTANVCSNSTSMVLSCGNRCSRRNSRSVKTMLLRFFSLSLPGLGRKTYTIDQFANQLITAQPHLRVAAVTK